MLVLRTLNFHGETFRLIVPRHKRSIVFSSMWHFKNRIELFSTFLDDRHYSVKFEKENRQKSTQSRSINVSFFFYKPACFLRNFCDRCYGPLNTIQSHNQFKLTVESEKI